MYLVCSMAFEYIGCGVLFCPGKHVWFAADEIVEAKATHAAKGTLYSPSQSNWAYTTLMRADQPYCHACVMYTYIYFLSCVWLVSLVSGGCSSIYRTPRSLPRRCSTEMCGAMRV